MPNIFGVDISFDSIGSWLKNAAADVFDGTIDLAGAVLDIPITAVNAILPESYEIDVKPSDLLPGVDSVTADADGIFESAFTGLGKIVTAPFGNLLDDDFVGSWARVVGSVPDSLISIVDFGLDAATNKLGLSRNIVDAGKSSIRDSLKATSVASTALVGGVPGAGAGALALASTTPEKITKSFLETNKGTIASATNKGKTDWLTAAQLLYAGAAVYQAVQNKKINDDNIRYQRNQDKQAQDNWQKQFDETQKVNQSRIDQINAQNKRDEETHERNKKQADFLLNRPSMNIPRGYNIFTSYQRPLQEMLPEQTTTAVT